MFHGRDLLDLTRETGGGIDEVGDRDIGTKGARPSIGFRTKGRAPGFQPREGDWNTMTKRQRDNLRSRLLAIRGWAKCITGPVDVMQLNPACRIDKVPAAPLQSIVGTVDKMLGELEPQKGGTR